MVQGFESCITNNDRASNFFSVPGVSAKVVLSPLTFHSFSRNSGQSNPEKCRLKSLTVKDTELKLNQYTDDTTLSFEGSKKSLSEAPGILD